MKIMKHISSYKIFILCLVGSLLIELGTAQSIEKIEHITKIYAIDPAARIEVSNKYGNIHINTWEKDSIKIKIEYTIKAKDAKRFNKAKESLDFEFIETSHYVIARTKFLSSGKELFRDLSSAISNSSSSSIAVNYEMFVPVNARLNITNKYGDVYTEDLAGDVTFDLGYGIFKAHDFFGHVDLTLNNCQTAINSVSVGILTLNYGSLIISEAGSIKLNSKYSKTNIHTIDAITLDGKNDEITMENCGKANISGNFSRFTVSNLKGNFNAITKYGNLDLYFAKNYSGDVSLNTKYTDISLRIFSEESHIKTEIRHQRSKLSYPATFVRLVEEKISGNDVIYHSTGSIGKGEPNNSTLNIGMESGDLSIYSR